MAYGVAVIVAVGIAWRLTLAWLDAGEAGEWSTRQSMGTAEADGGVAPMTGHNTDTPEQAVTATVVALGRRAVAQRGVRLVARAAR